MKVKRFSDEEIQAILAEAGPDDLADGYADICRKYDISVPTLVRWRAKYGGHELDLNELRAENARLKRLVAKQAADIARLRNVLARRT